jgi:hypothetical protein
MKPLLSGLKCQQLEQIYPPKIETWYSQSKLWSRLENLWQFLARRLTDSPQLRVWHTYDDQGNIWWSAYNPKTGQSIHQISEEQIRVWIEQRYL